MAEGYKGYKIIALNEQEMAEFYQSNRLKDNLILLENEFLLIANDDGKIVDKFLYQDSQLQKVTHTVIENNLCGLIKPRNLYQLLAISLLNDPTIPVKVLTGVYGSAKAQPINTIIPTPEGLKRMGEIRVGDYIFDREGKPTEVLGVFPQGKIDCYKITFSDGRETYCGEEHLWSHITSKGNLTTKTTKEMYKLGVKAPSGNYRFKLPLNSALEYKTKDFEIDPYVLGCFLGDGCCLEKPLTLSSNDEELVAEVSRLIGSPEYYKAHENNYSWYFKTPQKDGKKRRFQTKEFFKNYPEVIDYALNKHIPEEYFYGDRQQRLSLLQGLLDTDGTISKEKGRVSFASTSERLKNDVKRLVYELGYSCGEHIDNRKERKNPLYCLSIIAPNEDKVSFFRLRRKKQRALDNLKQRQLTHSTTLTIRSIEKMTYQEEMVCFYVDNDEHLYLTNDCIVTHNTFLMINAALQCLESGNKEKIIFVRNGISPKGVPDIGYLPGSALDKTLVWAMPIADHVGGEDGLLHLIESRKLEVLPLNYIRGRDLKNAIIFSDESENLTPKLIQLLLGRVGENSELWIAGDYRQSDLGKSFSEGLTFMIERLKGNRLFGYVDLPITERSKIAELSNLLDN